MGAVAALLGDILYEAHRRKLRVSRMLPQHCPLTAATRGLLGAAELRAMKRGALLVNYGRGELIDKQARVAATARRTATHDRAVAVAHCNADGTLCRRGT